MTARSALAHRDWLLPCLMVTCVLVCGHMVAAGYFADFDYRLSVLLNMREGESPPALIKLMHAISWIGGGARRYILLALLVSVVLICGKGWRLAGGMAVAVLLANAASSMLKLYFARLRPDLTEHLYAVSSLSFPSGHATSAAASALLFILIMRGRVRVVWLWIVGLYALLSGLSRLMLAVHWPTDIIAGFLVGSAFALAGYAVLKRTADMRAI